MSDKAGIPVPILGRAAWFVISLSATDYQTFINDTAAKGYNAIEINAITHDPRANLAPYANGKTLLPFLKRLDGTAWTGSLSYTTPSNEAPDFTTPNPAYWSFLDSFLSYCQSKGIVVFMFPSYLGYGAGNQGWAQEMVANGVTKMSSFGNWIATRYQNQTNLVWMLAGDYGGPSALPANLAATENSLIGGIKSVKQSTTLYSAELGSGSISTDDRVVGPSITLNGAYDFDGEVVTQGRRAYSYASTTLPSFLLEEPYDQEGPDGNNVNRNATQPVRRFQWWGWLSTVGGYISGNGYVWPFTSGWNNHLNTQGAQDMARLNAFIKSIAWWKLVPSGLGGIKNLITAGGGSGIGGPDYVAAAADAAGSLLVAYVPPAHSGSITVDMSAMSGPALVRWFDPTTASYSPIGTYPNTGTQTLNPPGRNSTGYTDWALVIQAL